MSRVVHLNNHAIELTHQERVLFPADGITKGEVIDYYERIAPFMAPHLHGRPLAMQRFTHDIKEGGFYQKQAGNYFPEWIEQVSIKNQDGGSVQYVVCNDAASLVYLANQGVLVYHIWPSAVGHLNYPDRMIFDLDPSGRATFADIRFAAQRLKQLLDELGLISFVMTTGSRGVHIVLPLEPIHTFNKVRTCARAIAQWLVNQHSDRLTLEIRKTKRVNKIFLDIIRNTYGHHSVAPYSLRALPGAPLATPISWDELLKKGIMPQSYTIKNIFRRLAQKNDPWADFGHKKNKLAGVVEKLKQRSILRQASSIR